MKNKIFNICNIYVFLWFIMNIKKFTYRIDIVSVMVYIFIVIISLYYAFKCYASKNNPVVIKVYNILFALLCVYGILNIIAGDVYNTYKGIPTDFYLQNVVKSMLPFYAFYAFAKDGYINRKWLCVFCIVFLTVSIINYNIKEDELMANVDISESGVTNNVGYAILSFMPLACFFYKRKLLQYSILAICLFFVILSVKRGAIIIAFAILLYFFMASVSKRNNRKWLSLFLAVALLITGYFFIEYLFETNTYFVSRVESTMEGQSSQRDFLFSYYWNMYWHESSTFEYFLGRGADGTIHTGNNYAHNDWLEIIVNQGMIGIIIFLLFWFQLFRLLISTPQNNVKVAFGMCIVLLFIRTFFSMSINEMTIYSTCVMGVFIAACNNNKIVEKLEA